MSIQIKSMLVGAALTLAGAGASQLFNVVVPEAHAQPGGWCKILKIQSVIDAESQLGQHFGRGATIVSFANLPSNNDGLPYRALVCGR